MTKPVKYKITYTHIPYGETQRVEWEKKEPEIYEFYDLRDWEVFFHLKEEVFECDRLRASFDERKTNNKNLRISNSEIGWEVA